MIKIWLTTFRNKVIKLFVVDYTWCCACPFLMLRTYFTISSTFINDVFFFPIGICFCQHLRRVKKLNWVFFLKRVVARTELKIVNFITSCLNTCDEIMVEVLILDMVDMLSTIFNNEAKNNCYFFVSFVWMILFVVISKK